MTETIWHRLDHGGRLALPLATTLVCVLLGSIVWPLPFLGTIAPPFALMSVYYWSLYRPDLFRPGMAFAVGLLHDIVNGLPIGLSALLFVAAHQMLYRERRYFVGHSFFMLWVGFMVTVAAVLLIQWLLLDIIRWQMIPLLPVLIQILCAIALFPLPCWILIGLQRLMFNTDN